MEKFIFFYLAIVMIISGILAVFSKNTIHALLWVLVLIIHQAFLLISLGSPFLGAVQIIVYAGAIIVLFLFVVYLINLRKEIQSKRFIFYFSPSFVAFLLFIVITSKSLIVLPSFIHTLKESTGFKSIYSFSDTPASLFSIAKNLFQHHFLAFELIGILLMIVLLGAVFLLKKLEREKQ